MLATPARVAGDGVRESEAGRGHAQAAGPQRRQARGAADHPSTHPARAPAARVRRQGAATDPGLTVTHTRHGSCACAHEPRRGIHKRSDARRRPDCAEIEWRAESGQRAQPCTQAGRRAIAPPEGGRLDRCDVARGRPSAPPRPPSRACPDTLSPPATAVLYSPGKPRDTSQ